MRVLNVAPFARGAAFGGSQRATVVVERLEERNACVTWAALPPRVPGRARRLAETVLREPAAVRHARRAADPPDGDFDVALAAHSYMAPKLSHTSGTPIRVVDFHNLEWRHLKDVGQFAGPTRRAHLGAQAALMRRYEYDLVRSCPITLFATRSELEWAEAVGGDGVRLHVPNLLPRAEVAAAAQVWEQRREASRDAQLVYVGKLTFPPNVLSLERFLHGTWPTIRSANPSVKLRVAGSCTPAVRDQLSRHPGVEVAGFIDDLRPTLTEATAAVFPFDGRAGSSLRVLLYALAGVPAIGTAAAFRGLPSELGTVVSSASEWAEAVQAVRAGTAPDPRARAAVLALHDDPGPWDALMTALRRRVGTAELGA
jgi:hypothetical protein